MLGISQTSRPLAGGSHSNRFAQVMSSIPNALLYAKRVGREREEREEVFEEPSVGVVVCAYNEENNIGPLLASLIRERVNEIVVVASGCTDNTVEIARRFQSVHRRTKVLVEKTRNGKTSAINLALRSVTSNFIVFLPADVRPAKGSIRTLIEGFKPEIGIRVGRPLPVDDESNAMGRLSHLIWTVHNRTLGELSAEGSLVHASGEFFALRQGIVSQLPGQVVNDDAYMAIAVRNAGFKIDYEKDAVAFMRGPGTVSDYVSQRRRVHYGHLQVMKSTGQYPTVFEAQAFVRPALFLQILRAEVKGLRGGLRALILGGTLEVISVALSGVDRLTRKNHVLWRMVESTKSLPVSLPLPFTTMNGVGIVSVSTPDAYPEQSLGRSWRSGLVHGQLSLRPEVSFLPVCR